MALEVEATYEQGFLKLDEPIPLQEHQRVVVQVKPKVSRIRQSAGLIKWRGDPEELRMIAEDPK
jgi:predicted DNA-binding antitoxin AbrB/MazE fold protein